MSKNIEDGWYYSAQGAAEGPCSSEQMQVLAGSGKIDGDTPVWHASFGAEWKRAYQTLFWDGPPPLVPRFPSTKPSDDETTMRRLADYQKVSGILWITLGIFQVLALVTIIAGVWNILVGIGRLGRANQIRACDPNVVADFEGIGSLVVVGIINLVFGAFIGVILIGVDFYVREKVLSNRRLFSDARVGIPRPIQA